MTVSFIDDIKIGNLMDLSIVEVVTLDALLRYGAPMVRHSLYVYVNEYIRNQKVDLEKYAKNNLSEHEAKFYEYIQKKEEGCADLSTSSFYNNLKNLEKKGLIKFNKNSKGKVETVEATPLTRRVIKHLLQFFMDSSAIPDFSEFDVEVTQKVQRTIGQDHVGNLLAVWFEKHISLRLTKLFRTVADEVFVLSKIEDYSDYEVNELQNVHYTRIIKRMIREPNNVMDTVVIPQYRRNINFFGMSRVDVLKELKRILKKEGALTVVCKDQISLTEDVAADELLKIYKESISDEIFTDQDLREDFRAAGFNILETFNHKGMRIIIGEPIK